MKRILFKNSILFIVGFCIYITAEVLYRGYSYPLMGVCAGTVIIFLDKINDLLSWDIDILWQCAFGSLLITLMELLIGKAFLAGYLPVMWDYSSVPLNYEGIICMPFSLIWAVLSFAAVLLADAINYYVFQELPIPYYKCFGKIILTFPKINKRKD